MHLQSRPAAPDLTTLVAPLELVELVAPDLTTLVGLVAPDLTTLVGLVAPDLTALVAPPESAGCSRFNYLGWVGCSRFDCPGRTSRVG